MVGPTACGKTQFAKALAKEHGWNMLIANHREGLKDLTFEYNAIFFDDLSFQDLDHDTILAILESKDFTTIRVLYGAVDKKGGMVQMMAFNDRVWEELCPIFERHEYARKFCVAHIPNNFIITSTLVNNVSYKIHNHIYNNPDTIRANRQAIIEIMNPYHCHCTKVQ